MEDTYARTRNIKMLKPDEERRLIKAYHECQCSASKQKLILSFVPLARSLARSASKKSTIPEHDLLQEAMIGLLKALERFDVAQPVRFSTYAAFWVKASIQEAEVRMSGIIRPPATSETKRVRSTLPRIRTKMTNEAWKNGRHVTENEIRDQAACIMNIPREKIDQIDRTMFYNALSIHPPAYNEEHGHFGIQMRDESDGPEEILVNTASISNSKRLVGEVGKKLTEREFDVVQRRRLIDPPQTLQDIAQDYCISKERVRQIENTAIKKMEAGLKRMNVCSMADV